MNFPMDDLLDELRDLASEPVPVAVDVDRAMREGGLLLRKRRARAAAGVALVGLVLGGVSASEWWTSESGVRLNADAAGVPSAEPSAHQWTWLDSGSDRIPPASLDEPGGVEPRWRPSEEEELLGVESMLPEGMTLGYVSGGESLDDWKSYFGSILEGGRAGYVARLVATRASSGCDIAISPPSPEGRECRTVSTNRGEVSVIWFDESEQGIVRTVVVAVGGLESVVTVSTGFPRTGRNINDPDQLPWDGRSPEGSSAHELRSPLKGLPLSLDEQVAAAWSALEG